MIYFIGEHETEGPVKIGYTTGEASGGSGRFCAMARLRALQCGNPRRLILLAIMDGDAAEEASLHRQFESARLVGEWFDRTCELAELIRGTRRNGFHAPGGLSVLVPLPKKLRAVV